MSEFIPPVRDDLVGVEAYGAPQLDVRARLNVNENPFPLPVAVAEALGAAVADAARGLNRYPEREALELRAALATYLRHESVCGVDGDHVWAANGSNEVMHHLFLAFGGPGRTALTFDPTYSMYPEYARDTFTRLVTRPRREDFSIDIDDAVATIEDVRPTLVVVASPNNPSGTAMTLEDIRALGRASLSVGAVFVVDEAYAEFRRTGTPSACTLLPELPNLVVSRTMSKAFAMAGLRLGYAAVADTRVIDALRVVRLPYHLSAVTQAAAIAALAHADVLQAQVALLRDERDRLAAWLAEQGYTVIPSDANFLLFGRFADREAVWRALLDQGVLIRATGPKPWLRVSIGTPDENAMFKDALLTTGRPDGPHRTH